MPEATRPVGVWGLGREGLSVTRFLVGEGRRVVAVDEVERARPPELPETVGFASGTGALDTLLACSLVIASPGVPRVHPFRKTLSERGIEVTTPTNIWLEKRAARTIGVTGTKGKSTTSSLIHLLLDSAGIETDLGGNIGVPLTDITESDSIVVAELSSYQCAYLQKSPRVAVVTSLFEDHLPWHGSKMQYWLDKSRIFTLGAEVLATTPQTLETLQTLGVELPETIRTIDDSRLDGLSDLPLPLPLSARHNLQNLKLALLAAWEVPGFDLTVPELAPSLAGFTPLPHRLEVVSDYSGLTWIDDTLSTNNESVLAALNSFGERPLTLILGGLDRGIDYGPLNAALIARAPAVNVVTIPTNGPHMVHAYADAFPARVHNASSLDQAVLLARDVSEKGALVILSPGAPSQDFYRDFASKSEHYTNVLAGLAASTPETDQGSPE